MDSILARATDLRYADAMPCGTQDNPTTSAANNAFHDALRAAAADEYEYNREYAHLTLIDVRDNIAHLQTHFGDSTRRCIVREHAPTILSAVAAATGCAAATLRCPSDGSNMGLPLDWVEPAPLPKPPQAASLTEASVRDLAAQHITCIEFDVILDLARTKGLADERVLALIAATVRKAKKHPGAIRSVVGVIRSTIMNASTHTSRTPTPPKRKVGEEDTPVTPTPPAEKRIDTCQRINTELLRYPALVISPESSISVLGTFRADDSTVQRIKISRTSERGWSPEIAALFMYLCDRAIADARRVDEYAYEIRVPINAVAPYFGGSDASVRRSIYRTAESLHASFVLYFLSRPRAKSSAPTHITTGVKPIRGIAISGDHLLVRWDVQWVDSLRYSRNDELRRVSSEALPSLSTLSRYDAALTMWLAPRWHGSQHMQQPIIRDVPTITRELTGTEMPPTPAQYLLRKYRSRLRQASETINQRDLLAPLDIQHPRVIDMQFTTDSVAIYRRSPTI